MYIIVSCDFAYGTFVKIHTLTSNLTFATETYNNIIEKVENLPLELLEIPDDFMSENGHTLFWDGKNETSPEIKKILSNKKYISNNN